MHIPLTSTQVAEKFDMIPIPNGAYFKPHEASNEILNSEGLPEQFSGPRPRYSSINLLIPAGVKFNFHRALSSETFEHLEGEDMALHLIDSNGRYQRILVGHHDPTAMAQYVVPPRTWFAEASISKDGYSLLRVTNEPGFHADDIVQATREELMILCHDQPNISEIIISMTLNRDH